MDTHKQIYFVRDRHIRISEVLNDCVGNLCVKTYIDEPLSSVLKKICSKITDESIKNRVISASFTGTSTKTLTLTLHDGTSVTSSFIDKDSEITEKTVTNSTDTGTTGEVCWDSDYIYVCIDTDTWKRVSLSSW